LSFNNGPNIAIILVLRIVLVMNSSPFIHPLHSEISAISGIFKKFGINLRIPVDVVAMAVLLNLLTVGLKLQAGCRQHSPSFFTKVHMDGRL
jgi:hypothetical protein